MKKKLTILFFQLFCLVAISSGQSVSFELKTNPSIDFTFNTVARYINGLIIPDAVTLDIVATGTQWDLYVGSITTSAGTWDNVQYYSSDGNGFPSVGLLQVACRNTSNTSQISGYVPMQDISTTTLDIIGNHHSAPDPAVHCADAMHQGTNTPGSYVTDPQCYQFKVDFKVVPGLSYRAGMYSLQVDFIIAPDL